MDSFKVRGNELRNLAKSLVLEFMKTAPEYFTENESYIEPLFFP